MVKGLEMNDKQEKRGRRSGRMKEKGKRRSHGRRAVNKQDRGCGYVEEPSI